MPSGLEIVLTMAVLAAAAVLLTLVWMLIERTSGIGEGGRPREDPGLQLHQAQRNGSAGFGP